MLYDQAHRECRKHIDESNEYKYQGKIPDKRFIKIAGKIIDMVTGEDVTLEHKGEKYAA